MGQTVRVRVVAAGRVQGVFFRDSCRRQAAQRAVAGWVRNREDGRVEAVFEGGPDDVAAMVDWMRHGPDRAHVDEVETVDEEPEGLTGFRVR